MTHIQPLTEPETYRVQDVAAKVNELVEVVNALLSGTQMVYLPSGRCYVSVSPAGYHDVEEFYREDVTE